MKNGKEYANLAISNFGLEGAIAHTNEWLASPPAHLTPQQREKFVRIASCGLKRLLRSQREMRHYGFSQAERTGAK